MNADETCRCEVLDPTTEGGGTDPRSCPEHAYEAGRRHERTCYVQEREQSARIIRQLTDQVRDLDREIGELRKQRDWENVEDEWSRQIEKAFPTCSGSHKEYGIAMRMVGHRHSKAQLVSLVNWLLVTCARAGSVVVASTAEPVRPLADETPED